MASRPWYNMAEVYLNGKFIGTVEHLQDYVKHVVSERRKGSLDANINIRYDDQEQEVYIESNKGRLRRPLIVVRDGQPLLSEHHIRQLQKNELTWKDLLDQGVVEYLDAAEEENCLVAFSQEELTKEHTHMEIAPITMLGLTSALVPYGNYTQPARLVIGSKNQKQALGLYAGNYSVRMDMDVNILHSPQKPVVKTIIHDISDYNAHPSGQNVIVAVLSYNGYNMEDAIVINKGSIDRGFARSTYYRPELAEELKYSGGLVDTITIPDKEVKGYKSEKDYRLLEGDGIIFPEAVVQEGDVIIGKTSPPRFLSNLDEYNLTSNIRRESSSAMAHGEAGVIDFVLLTENEEGNKLVQVRVRDQRIPEIGDKFTSRHGQKGVVGLIVPEADMPFTTSGIIPDLLFSPHGIPSRMTISHLLELISGKTGALSGRYVDSSTFGPEPEKEIREELLRMGFKENGTEIMYNGVTGEQYHARIFIGSMYYLKLKHMVANRIQSRARGPIQLLTRQPTEGRAKEGGLRLGEMEKDTLVAHGTAMLLKERFDSDKTIVPVCENCGIIAVHDEYKDRKFCPICGDNVEINNIEIAYAFKLMLDEFKALGIYPKLILENKY